MVVVNERILNEGKGGGVELIKRCCCVFSGSPVSCYMRTRVQSVHLIYVQRKKEEKVGCK